MIRSKLNILYDRGGTSMAQVSKNFREKILNWYGHVMTREDNH